MSASFRVTQRSAALGVQTNLQRNISAMQQLQERLSSGKQISVPSDDPSGTATALSLRNDIKRAEQFDRNANDGAGWLAEADNAMQSASQAMRRVRDLTANGINATLTPNDREALAKEVDGLREQILATANTSRLGRPLFSGNATPAPGQPDVAYDATGTYKGDAGIVTRTVAPGSSVQVNLTGPEVFGPPGSDVFALLTNIAADLRTNPTNLSNDLAGIDTALGRLSTSLSTIGARTNQLETLQTKNLLTRDNYTKSLNDVESIDLPKTITDLQLQETAYQAALSAAAKVIQPSLMDFLR